MKLKIAGINIELNSWHKDFFEDFFKEYIVEDAETIDFRLDCIVHGGVELPKDDPIKSTEKHEYKELIFELDDQTLCDVLLGIGEEIICKSTFSKDYSRIKVEINSEYNDKNRTLMQRELIYTSYATANFFSYNKALIIKGDLVELDNGKCVLIAGRTNWEERTILRMEGGKIVAHNTPWSKKNNEKNKKVIDAFVIIEDGYEGVIRKVSTIEAIYYLAKCVFKPHYEVSVANKNMNEIENIIRDYPIFMVACDDVDKCVELCEEFFRDK